MAFLTFSSESLNHFLRIFDILKKKPLANENIQDVTFAMKKLSIK